MSLFRYGDFTLHSGEETFFKIDCDALTDEDLYTLAILIKEVVGTYGQVEGVPTGGLRLAEQLKKFCSTYSQRLLIVDDVLTTGASMEEQRAGRDAFGIVIFARGVCPEWVHAIFHMTDD